MLSKPQAYTLVILLMFIGIFGHAQDPNFIWGKSTTSSKPNGACFDTNHDLIITGYFIGTVDFDPNAGTTLLQSQGAGDGYLQHLSKNGNLLWIKAFHGTSDIISNDVALTKSGNIVVVGEYNGTIDLDPGTGIYSTTSNGSRDAYVVMLDSNGSFIWGKSFGGPSTDRCLQVSIDEHDNIYVTGTFAGNMDSDPGPAVNTVSAFQGADGYVMKLDGNGDLVWFQHFGSPESQSFVSICVSDNQSVLIGGSYKGTIDFDQGAGSYLVSSESNTYDGFLLCLDTTGAFQWVNTLAGPSNQYPRNIETDASNFIYFTGDFHVSCDFDPGPGLNLINSEGFLDVFVQKYDANGSVIWSKVVSGKGWDYAFGLAIDVSNRVFISGEIGDTIDFDPGLGTSMYVPEQVASFILILNEDGDYDTVLTIDGSANEALDGLLADNQETLYAFGVFKSDTLDIDPGINNYEVHHSGTPFSDGLVMKFRNCQPFATTDTIIACDSITWIDGNTYTMSNNTAQHTLYAVNDCDSIVTLDLTIQNTAITFDTVEACGTFQWENGQVYSSSDSAIVDSLVSSSGCDSIAMLCLTIFELDTTVDVQYACDSFKWVNGTTYYSSTNLPQFQTQNVYGCDSVSKLELTIVNSASSYDTIAHCGPFTWINGLAYSVTDSSITDTFSTVNGCDSLAHLCLTIIGQPDTALENRIACDSLTWIDGKSYFESSDQITHKSTNASGCDSVAILDLEIKHSVTSIAEITSCEPITWIDGNTYNQDNRNAQFITAATNGCDSVIQLKLSIIPKDSIQLNATDNLLWVANHFEQYQWFQCDSIWNPLPDETSSTYLAESSGQYAVVGFDHGCADTSACIDVNPEASNQNVLDCHIIYPNPTSERFQLAPKAIKNSEIELYDSKGALLDHWSIESVESFEEQIQHAPGMYILRFVSASKTVACKLIKR